ncbi:hypothetical protein GYA19_02675 [Candidatus Beckwithbacteria bacterium]|nr:hypothetical protein [Candidatus Beckwithbacteria bacterium]
MLTAITLQDAMINSTNDVFLIFYSFLPRLLGAILVFLVGILLANWLKKLIVKILESINLSKIAKETKLQEFLQNAEIKTKLEEIIAAIFKWLVVLIFSVAAINLLGLDTISSILNGFLNYLPKVIASIFILALGVFLAGIVESLVKGAVAQIDLKTARLLGKIASYLVVVFATMAALTELGIAETLINILFIGMVAMLALGFGLAIGLGAKDTVGKIIEDSYKKFKKENGKK